MNTQQGVNHRREPYPNQIQQGIYESSNLPTTAHNQELYRVKAARIVDLLPDELVIQEKTVSVVRHQLLATYVETISVSEIGEVSLNKEGAFASVIIFGKNPREHVRIAGVPKDKAARAKILIESLYIK